ncbi:hypothetical protein HPP92_014412 [Vanilla planifolia]|nr:hypothetical protein HPP92_014412 [Vanilla planifolia]
MGIGRVYYFFGSRYLGEHQLNLIAFSLQPREVWRGTCQAVVGGEPGTDTEHNTCNSALCSTFVDPPDEKKNRKKKPKKRNSDWAKNDKDLKGKVYHSMYTLKVAVAVFL